MANIDARFNGEIFRKDHPMIIAQNRQLASILPVRLAYNASGYVAGRVLGRNTTSGYFENYDGGASSGLDTASCVLFESHDVTEFQSATGTVIARGIFRGDVYKDLLLGLDAGAETDLNSRTIVDATGINILSF